MTKRAQRPPNLGSFRESLFVDHWSLFCWARNIYISVSIYIYYIYTDLLDGICQTVCSCSIVKLVVLSLWCWRNCGIICVLWHVHTFASYLKSQRTCRSLMMMWWWCVYYNINHAGYLSTFKRHYPHIFGPQRSVFSVAVFQTLGILYSGRSFPVSNCILS